MFVTINHVTAGDAATGRAIEARFSGRQRLVDEMPGFLSFEVLRPAPQLLPHGSGDRPLVYLAMTTWQDRAAFDAWRTSPQQRPVQPAQHGPLSGADAASWPTMHESFEAAEAPGWQRAAQSAAKPIAVMNVIEVAQAHTEVFEETFRTREGGAEGQHGFLSLAVLRPVMGTWDGPDAPETGKTHVVLTRWESADAFYTWTRSEAFRAAHGRRRLPEGAVLHSRLHTAEIVLPSYGEVAA